MAGREEDCDSDAPEEFTAEQGIQQAEELRKAELENKARVVKEGKERRRQWAQKKTPRKTKKKESVDEESQNIGGMLPKDIVNLLAAREKQVFTSDSEEEKPVKKTGSKKKRPKTSGLEPVILGSITTAQCAQSSLEFLKKRKMLVSRSSSVLNNSNQALRLLSTSGVLTKK